MKIPLQLLALNALSVTCVICATVTVICTDKTGFAAGLTIISLLFHHTPGNSND